MITFIVVGAAVFGGSDSRHHLCHLAMAMSECLTRQIALHDPVAWVIALTFAICCLPFALCPCVFPLQSALCPSPLCFPFVGCPLPFALCLCISPLPSALQPCLAITICSCSSNDKSHVSVGVVPNFSHVIIHLSRSYTLLM